MGVYESIFYHLEMTVSKNYSLGRIGIAVLERSD